MKKLRRLDWWGLGLVGLAGFDFAGEVRIIGWKCEEVCLLAGMTAAVFEEVGQEVCLRSCVLQAPNGPNQAKEVPLNGDSTGKFCQECAYFGMFEGVLSH